MKRKLFLLVGIGILFTFVVYLGLIDSLTRPSITYMSMSPDTAITILSEKYDIASLNSNNYEIQYVYIKGNGYVYNSNTETKDIGDLIGKSEPTTTTGNHFAWQIFIPNLNQSYYIDHVSGDLISAN
ncbi:MAG: hypothetical protein ACPKQO_06095 [Nitrososphaeraceae archaeon]